MTELPLPDVVAVRSLCRRGPIGIFNPLWCEGGAEGEVEGDGSEGNVGADADAAEVDSGGV